MSYTNRALTVAKRTANGAIWALTGIELADLLRGDKNNENSVSESKILESLQKIENELNIVKKENDKLEENHENTNKAVYAMVLFIIILAGAKIYIMIKKSMMQKITHKVVFREDRLPNA